MSDLEFSPIIELPRRISNPPLKVWLRHFLLFLLTFVTTTITGTVPLLSLEFLFEKRLPIAQSTLENLWQITLLPGLYLQIIGDKVAGMFQDPGVLLEGLAYSGPLLFILICHEFGHYIACRIYRVEATLPFFLPSPPLIGVGTFGAFIRILSPLPSRKAIFDIGVAGPIAGFIALVPVAILGVYYAQPVPPGATAPIIFSDPLLMRLIGWMMGVDVVNAQTNSFYTAAWIGLLVTSLNLIPSGQLDGGHAIYAVFGKGFHALTTKIAFVVMATLSVLGIILYNSPVGILFAVILAVMIRIGHPEPYDYTPLDMKRRIIAVITLIIFALSFVPFPIQINF